MIVFVDIEKIMMQIKALLNNYSLSYITIFKTRHLIKCLINIILKLTIISVKPSEIIHYSVIRNVSVNRIHVLHFSLFAVACYFCNFVWHTTCIYMLLKNLLNIY